MLTPRQIGQLRRAKLTGRNKLGEAIRLVGFTQEQIAERVGLTQSHVSVIVGGRYGSEFPMETARKFARFFGVSIEDLFPARDETAVSA